MVETLNRCSWVNPILVGARSSGMPAAYWVYRLRRGDRPVGMVARPAHVDQAIRVLSRVAVLRGE